MAITGPHPTAPHRRPAPRTPAAPRRAGHVAAWRRGAPRAAPRPAGRGDPAGADLLYGLPLPGVRRPVVVQPRAAGLVADVCPALGDALPQRRVAVGRPATWDAHLLGYLCPARPGLR